MAGKAVKAFGKALKAVGKAAEQSLVRELDQEVDSDWPITPQRRELIVRALLEVVISGDSDTAKVRAAEVLGKLDGLSAQAPGSDEYSECGDFAAGLFAA